MFKVNVKMLKAKLSMYCSDVKITVCIKHKAS